MAEPMLGKDVPNTIEKENVDCKEQIYLEETFYILSKKKSVFRVRLTSKGLSLIKETDDSSKEQTILLRDIIGSKCMRSKRRRAGAGSCVCSSLVGPQQLKVVDENSGDLDETNQPITTIIPQNDKKLLILLNPKSGPGKARELFQTKSAPLLQEAEVPYDLHITKYAQYAREFVRTRNVYGWRGIVAAGGDGVLFEILNGMFERLDWQQALAEVPLAILPCGSGNGLARTICYHYNEPYIRENLTGISMGLARGRVAPMDVVRVETKTNIMFSFLSVGWGLLSDIDIESERLRAIGGQRFAIWALARLVGLRKYKGVVSYAKIKDVSNLPKPKLPITLSHSVSQDGALDSPDAEAFIDCDEHSEVFTNAVNGKHQRVDSWYSVNSRRSAFYSTRGSEYHSVASGGSEMRSPVHACMHGPASHLPSLMSQLPSHWVHEEGEFVMVHVSYQAYIGEDLLFAPRSQLSDGVMWMLIIKAGIPRSQILSFLLGMGQGTHSDVNTEFIKMIPVSAFRIVPEGPDGYLTVDGELVEYGPLQAEIFPNIVHLLVPDTK
ncbi:Sphingosine kinase 2 [Papilio machaon]|uniref:sphingosine kinase n=1 Tax=Papilio machaon TaxID=76193 RepID=A0A0N0PAT2_PAPMA|nr:Sphingosine kinase 2 [Papilio machaon]